MFELQGKYNMAKVFTDNADSETVSQIMRVLNQEFAAGSQIRIMPDTHAGAGCTIGTTMTIHGKVVPFMVGVDIGCGMETVLLKDKHIEPQQIDRVIHKNIPAGFEIREKAHAMAEQTTIEKLRCAEEVNLDRGYKSIGTLGGGNHFIEIDRDDEGRYYLVVHSGSRHIGKQVAEFYQKEAEIQRKLGGSSRREFIALMKSQGRQKEIQKELKSLPADVSGIDRSLMFLEGSLLDDYLHDMAITQEYAGVNRKCIVREILKNSGLKAEESFTTIHNYIDIENKILRKGAISAREGERVLIPINMRDGSLICTGRGNPDWNFSAPHGAGRLMSRSAARSAITMSQYKKSMEGIYSTTVSESTLDESPFAYKPIEEIIANIQDTVLIDKIIKPVYNFKAAESDTPFSRKKKLAREKGR
ncbi:MAG: RtcB family protein [Oscillospiraceae bacterium]|jgi:RNA-splicing ligase RtcB|nr:RtcB family protein [Oscillospiraceae bacterium]